MSSCFLVWFFSNNLFTCFFAKVFLLLPKLSELISFIWNHQKCTGSPNIWCLIKTQLKTITQTIFQGGSPWATLIHNSVACLGGTLLCPDASWGVFFQTIPLPVTLLQLFSFMVFLWYSYWISMEFLLEFPWCFYDISGGFLWDFWRGAMGVLWYSYWISIGFL